MSEPVTDTCRACGAPLVFDWPLDTWHHAAPTTCNLWSTP